MRLPKGDNQPSAFQWLTAAASLLLPVIGVATALIGVLEVGRGHTDGWYWIGAGIALILADMVVDWLWARPSVSKSDEPDLNRRGAELVGQFATVTAPIERGGRGAVQAGDTVWAAEGAEAAAGARVKIIGVKGTVLLVARS